MSSRSLTLAEARRRVDQVESLQYDVHLDLTDPATYVGRYAELGPELATRSSAFANVVGWGFPLLALDAEQPGRTAGRPPLRRTVRRGHRTWR